MKFECATVEEAQAKVQELMDENKWVIGALQTPTGFVVEWQEHKKYTAQDGKEFFDEVWVTVEGKMILVQDLEPEHCRNVLRMILRQRRESAMAMAEVTKKLQSAFESMQGNSNEIDDEVFVPAAEPARMLH